MAIEEKAYEEEVLRTDSGLESSIDQTDQSLSNSMASPKKKLTAGECDDFGQAVLGFEADQSSKGVKVKVKKVRSNAHVQLFKISEDK